MFAQIAGLLFLLTAIAGAPVAEPQDQPPPVGGATVEADVSGEMEDETDEVTGRLVGSQETLAHYVLSLATGKFMAITKSGRVQANAQLGKIMLTLCTRGRSHLLMMPANMH